MRRRVRGLTLVELLVVAVMMAILTSALGYAFIAGIDLERSQSQRRSLTAQRERVELRLTRLLEGAKLDDNPDDTTTFFLGLNETQSGGDLGCDRLTFTTAAPGVPQSAQENTDDFTTQHDANGPIGGTSEVSWSLEPVGDAGDKTGLFERLQQPSDGDSTQGGTESLLSNEIATIGFQFYDGQEWVTEWTTIDAERRLPEAVQISYTLTSDPTSTVYRLIVPIPASDVDANNIANTGVAQ